MNTIYDGSFVLGQTSAENPSLLVNENSEGNVSILQGTVATSAGIVGDGTTQNPLRADETVLWSGNAATYSAGAFSENPWNFQYIQFHQSNLQGGECVTLVQPFDNPNSADRSFVILSPRGNNEINYDAVKVLMNPTGWSATNSKTLQMSWTTTAFVNANNVANAIKSITKIVGINRIANN